MKKIPLNGKHGKNKFALVDDEDFEYLNQWKWYCDPHRNTFYVKRGTRVKRKYFHIRIHRVLMKTPKNLLVDHLDGNGLNNQKKNLRNCSNAENCQNRHNPTKAKSKYRGVYKRQIPNYSPNFKKVWFSVIRVNMKRIYLGTFYTPEKAYEAYKKASRKYRGKFSIV